MKQFNEQALREFRVVLEFRGLALQKLKKDATMFKKLCFLVLTEKLNIDQAADRAARIITGYIQ